MKKIDKRAIIILNCHRVRKQVIENVNTVFFKVPKKMLKKADMVLISITSEYHFEIFRGLHAYTLQAGSRPWSIRKAY